MAEIWTAERIVAPDLARELVAEAAPELKDAPLAPLGSGWDNTAYLVGGRWVFRFPRREVAAGLMDTEIRVLPRIAPRLPFPMPCPVYVGRGDERFPWPFAGYALIEGEAVAERSPDRAASGRLAPALGELLAALHSCPAEELLAAGAPHDDWRRLDLPYRLEQLRELAPSAPPDAAALVELAERCAVPGWKPRSDTPVHGDLDARHLLLDGGGALSGTIDWGDVHVGDPAIDLAAAHMVLPPEAHDAFRAAYGPVSDETWSIARFRAADHTLSVMHWSVAVGEHEVLRSMRASAEYLLEASG
ncbi:MAG: phosphotransferase [Planctomycetota bacterium]